MGCGQIHTSVQAGGMARARIRASVARSRMVVPSGRAVAEAAPAPPPGDAGPVVGGVAQAGLTGGTPGIRGVGHRRCGVVTRARCASAGRPAPWPRAALAHARRMPDGRRTDAGRLPRYLVRDVAASRTHPVAVRPIRPAPDTRAARRRGRPLAAGTPRPPEETEPWTPSPSRAAHVCPRPRTHPRRQRRPRHRHRSPAPPPRTRPSSWMHATKRFGDPIAVDDISLRRADRHHPRRHRSVRRRQDHDDPDADRRPRADRGHGPGPRRGPAAVHAARRASGSATCPSSSPSTRT